MFGLSSLQYTTWNLHVLSDLILRESLKNKTILFIMLELLKK